MKARRFLLGSAALVSSIAGAQAQTAEPVDYVRICDAFGTGFYYIPGTDTCLRVAGRVRVESHYVDGDVDDYYGVPTSEVNNWTTRARGYIYLDSRAQTDIGLVRAYISAHFTVGPGDATDPDANPNYSGTDPSLEEAFIQISNDWGTYTAGHTASFFDFYDTHGYYNPRGPGVDASTSETTLFAWTFSGGNGFSFTFAAEDPATSGRRRNGDDDYEGQEGPDGVANIRVEQGWGSAQVMGAVRHINDVNGDGIGFAVAGGVSINVPGGWTFDGMGGYSEGAIAYITSDPGGLGDFDSPTGDEKNQAWAVKAGITGPVGNNMEAWLDGSFTHVEEADGADEYDFWGVTAGIAWNPVPGLSIGPEFGYSSLDMTDGADGTDEQTNYDVWSVMWRIQRDF